MFLSVRSPRASRIAAAMSWAVTDPNRRPSAPACWAIACRPLGRFLALADHFDRALCGRLGELARDQEVA